MPVWVTGVLARLLIARMLLPMAHSERCTDCWHAPHELAWWQRSNGVHAPAASLQVQQHDLQPFRVHARRCGRVLAQVSHLFEPGQLCSTGYCCLHKGQHGCKLEWVTALWRLRKLSISVAASRFQLERLGFFYVDPDSTISDVGRRLVLNRTCTLRDPYAKSAAK